MIKNVKSEEGSVVLLALMVLLLITMFGFSALNTADTELLVAQSTRCYKQNLYRAEGMVMEAAQTLTTSTPAQITPNDPSQAAWLVDGTVATPVFNPESGDWEATGAPVQQTQLANVTNLAQANYTVVFEGATQGSSLTMGSQAQIWQYAVYGKSNICNGEIGVVAGYRRQF